MRLSPGARSARARLAAYSRWSRTADRIAATTRLRAGFDKRFEAEVDKLDPEHVLPEDTRQKMIASARSAYFSRLAFRRLKKAGRAS